MVDVFIVILLLSAIILVIDRRYRDDIGRTRNKHGICYRCNENLLPGLTIPFRMSAQFCGFLCADTELNRDEKRLLIMTLLVGLIYVAFTIVFWSYSVWVAWVPAFAAVIVLVRASIYFKRIHVIKSTVTQSAIDLSLLTMPDGFSKNKPSKDAEELVLETKKLLENTTDRADKAILELMLRQHYKTQEQEEMLRRAAESRCRAGAYHYQAIMDSRPLVATNKFFGLLLSSALVITGSIVTVTGQSLVTRSLLVGAAITGLIMLLYLDALREATLKKKRTYLTEIVNAKLLNGDNRAGSVVDIYSAPLSSAFYTFLLFICGCLFVAVGWLRDDGIPAIVMGIPLVIYGSIRVPIVFAEYGKTQLAIKQNGVTLKNGVHLDWSEIEDIQYLKIRSRYHVARPAPSLALLIKDSRKDMSACSWDCRLKRRLGFKTKAYYRVFLYLPDEDADGVYKICKSLWMSKRSPDEVQRNPV